ncbi:MAG: helix-turn-helix transcriptional regulator [Bacteroidales bacterium]|nr:helix-turn-helix transcriptional regulator [Bacteroidales bacterium]
MNGIIDTFVSNYLHIVMTEKQERILKAALHLFAREGYNATSTSKVAKLAGVSEGLIFRHFCNKEGLLNAILKEGEIRAKTLFADIVMETNPELVIRKTISMPFEVKEEEYEFWHLMYKLKWELKHYNEAKMEPLIMALTHAFTKLNYKNPNLEAEFMVICIDGLVGAILKGSLTHSMEMQQFLIDKYEL